MQGHTYRRRFTGAALAAVAVLGAALAAAPTSQAKTYGQELNGAYRALSVGNYARTNQVFIDEATVDAVWTISTSCTYPTRCHGTVTSNQGWTEPIKYMEDHWEVFHDVQNWITCPDGSTAIGHQVFTFSGRDANGQADDNPNFLGGHDITTGPSGACGVNNSLEKALPFRLTKLP